MDNIEYSNTRDRCKLLHLFIRRYSVTTMFVSFRVVLQILNIGMRINENVFFLIVRSSYELLFSSEGTTVAHTLPFKIIEICKNTVSAIYLSVQAFGILLNA